MPKGTPINPPETKEVPHQHFAHGLQWEDPFHWLKSRDNPEVAKHLRVENDYTNAVMSQFSDLPDRLYKELIGRIEESNVSAPFSDGDYIYQSRIEKGSDYRQYYRKKKESQGGWKLYFDAQLEARDSDYFDLAFLDVSPDGQTLAYAEDLDGDELYCLRFRDLESGKELDDVITDISGEGDWDAESKTYFYVREDESRRPFQIFRHILGSNPDSAVKVYEEKDPIFHAGLSKSQDLKYLFAFSESKETTETSYLEASDSIGNFKSLFKRRTGIQYSIEHHKGTWLVRTNEGAPDYKLLTCPVSSPDLDQARVLIPSSKSIRFNEIIPFSNHFVIIEREEGLDRIRIRNLTTLEEHTIETPDPVYDIHPDVNADFETEFFTCVYSSPIRPPQTMRHNMDNRQQEVIHSTIIPSGHEPDDYEVYRIHAVSSDGTAIPATIIHKKDLPRNGNQPTFLYGYGSYGSSVDANFRSSWLTWLERGFVIAIAHVRGGGLLGEDWYQSGKLHKKSNSFDDFIAVSEALINTKFTNSDNLVIEGGSAGGLLVGTALNKRPDLFKAALADVPFVDALNTMLDSSLPLTTFEYEEWGNPNDLKVFNNIRSYSPYENVDKLHYPAILATAGLNDPRVPYWEPAKWIARIRKFSTSGNPVLLKTYLDSGHAGASGRYGRLKEVAFGQAFLLGQVSETIEED